MNRTASNAYPTQGSSALAPRRSTFTVYEGFRRPHAERASAEEPREQLAPIQKLQALVLIVAVFVALGLTLVLSNARQARSFNETFSSMPRITVTVRPGDSLWSIAQDHAPSGTSTASVVRWISQENNLDSSFIMAGQTLIVPAPNEGART